MNVLKTSNELKGEKKYYITCVYAFSTLLNWNDPKLNVNNYDMNRGREYSRESHMEIMLPAVSLLINC